MGETFDVAPFVDARCQTPLDEIQAAVDGAISSEQAVDVLAFGHQDNGAGQTAGEQHLAGTQGGLAAGPNTKSK